MIDAKNFSGRGQVAILRTRPETVLDDYYRLMRLCDYEQNLPKDKTTLLKVNISWQIWYPACSTTPWQLDGVIRALLRDGYAREKIVAAHNSTVVVDAKEGARNNRHKLVQDHYGIRDLSTDEAGVEWVRYEPRVPLAVLDQIYPQGIYIPKAFYDKNVLHLPTMKTHVFTTLTGAMKNAFGGLLNEQRHWTHANIHDTLVDLLQIQQDIHTGIFCVMDGTFAGEGPGPRAMRPYVKNTIMASADPVAIDAMSAKIMGIDPLRVPSRILRRCCRLRPHTTRPPRGLAGSEARSESVHRFTELWRVPDALLTRRAVKCLAAPVGVPAPDARLSDSTPIAI